MKTKAHPTQHLEAAFVTKWKKVSAPLKGDIRAALKRGESPSKAVAKAFHQRDIRKHLKDMTLDMVEEAIKIGKRKK
jgi:hypothetical protein